MQSEKKWSGNLTNVYLMKKNKELVKETKTHQFSRTSLRPDEDPAHTGEEEYFEETR